MKVAVFLGDLSETDVGGFTFQDDILHALLAEAPSSEHEFVICGRASTAARKWIEAAGLTFMSLAGLLSNRGRRFIEVTLEDLLLITRAAGVKSRFDRALAAHGVGLVWYVGPLYEPTDLPFVYTIWDLQHRIQPWFPEVSAAGRWLFRERSYRQMIQRAYAIITPNKTAAAEIERCYGVGGNRVLQLPHPTPSFALAPPANSPAGRKLCPSPYVLYPAQFIAHKNHVGVLRSIKRLEDLHGIKMNMAFVGPDAGNLMHVRNEAERLGIDGRLYLPGFVAREELIDLYRNAFALLFLSFFGPENLPPLEAFALGCPVIAANVDGIEEQLGNAAILVDPVDYDDVANRLHQLHEQPALRSSLVKSGHARAKSWTTSDYVQHVLQRIDTFQRIRDCWPDRPASN